jgi:mannan endo-1,4-beta-mannosidase
MDTHKRVFGFKIIFLVSVFILLNESSKCSSSGVMDDEQFKTMVEEVDNHLPSSSSSQG